MKMYSYNLLELWALLLVDVEEKEVLSETRRITVIFLILLNSVLLQEQIYHWMEVVVVAEEVVVYHS
jgi:hypothetical protein